LHPDGAGNRVRGCREGNHQAVAEALHLPSRRGSDLFPQEREVDSSEAVETGLTEPGEHLRRRHQIGEQK